MTNSSSSSSNPGGSPKDLDDGLGSTPDHTDHTEYSSDHTSSYSPSHVHPNGHGPTGELIEGEYELLDDGLSTGNEASQEDVDQSARELAAQIHPQRIVLPEGASRADAIHILAKSIPPNKYGLPTFFYRSDFLPYDLGTLTTELGDAAAVPLEYHEGYPTYDDGHIFWHQLPHEPYEDYQLFVRYLEQAEDMGIRQLQLLASVNRISLTKVSSLSKEYFWAQRARAYDLFQVAADQKKREIRARRAENRHFEVAKNLFDQLLAKFDDPEWINTLSPADALDALQQLVKIQRVSLGLSVNGNAGPAANDPNVGQTAELILRNITKSSSEEGDSVSLTEDLQTLMGDPNFTLKAQELIFRMQRGS